MNAPDIHPLEELLGYRFRHPWLRDLALVHPSARHENALPDDNQRLEFLGDAVLGLLAAESGYERQPPLDEGRLTVLRSAASSAGPLTDIARSIQLGTHLQLGRGEESSGGRERASNLADALEALIGACYLDGGLPAARLVFTKWFLPRIEASASEDTLDNPKGRLQEWAQQRALPCPVYEVTGEEGPSHDKLYSVEVRIGDLYKASGSGKGKRPAEAAAAQSLWASLPR